MSHTIFNVFGVIWALILFKPFLGLVGKTIELFGLPNPAAADFSVISPDDPTGTAALYGLSMLHTLFNTINTLILVWFTNLIAKAVCAIIKTPANKEEAFRLKYIEAGPLATPELATEQAIKEIIHFAQIDRNGLGYVRSAINESDPDKFEELREKLVKYEEISDRIEYEIATFLNAVSAEDNINNLRNHLRDEEIEGLESNRTNYQTSVYYMDIVNELEKMGDFMINVSQDLYKCKIKVS